MYLTQWGVSLPTRRSLPLPTPCPFLSSTTGRDGTEGVGVMMWLSTIVLETENKFLRCLFLVLTTPVHLDTVRHQDGEQFDIL